MLFDAVYPRQSGKHTQEYYDWRYTKAFEKEAVSVMVYQDDNFIAQATIFQQSFNIEDKTVLSAQLGDLAIHPDHRSPLIVRGLYKQLSSYLKDKSYSLVFTTPNEQSKRLNQRFLSLEKKEIDFRLGFAMPPIKLVPNVIHELIKPDSFPRIEENLTTCSSRWSSNSIKWAPRELFLKCCDPHKKHYLHHSDRLVAITTKEKRFGMSFFLIKAFAKENERILVGKESTRCFINSIAKFHRTPIYLYWGKNLDAKDVERLTISISRFLQPISIQYRSEIKEDFPFDKIELIDLDIY
ncbi:MAG: GNAT family N-acetyltransferase [Lentilitoribacter sp.]